MDNGVSDGGADEGPYYDDRGTGRRRSLQSRHVAHGGRCLTSSHGRRLLKAESVSEVFVTYLFNSLSADNYAQPEKVRPAGADLLSLRESWRVCRQALCSSVESCYRCRKSCKVVTML